MAFFATSQTSDGFKVTNEGQRAEVFTKFEPKLFCSKTGELA